MSGTQWASAGLHGAFFQQWHLMATRGHDHGGSSRSKAAGRPPVDCMNSKGALHKGKMASLNLLLEVREGIRVTKERPLTPAHVWSFTPVLLSASRIVGAEMIEEENVTPCDMVCGLETSWSSLGGIWGKGWCTMPWGLTSGLHFCLQTFYQLSCSSRPLSCGIYLSFIFKWSRQIS